MIWFYLQGLTFTKVPKIKSLIIVGGAKFRAASLADKAYSTPIQCPSLHFLGTSSVSSTYSILQIQHFVIFLLMFCDGYGYYGYTPIIKHLKKKIFVLLYLPFFFWLRRRLYLLDYSKSNKNKILLKKIIILIKISH